MMRRCICLLAATLALPAAALPPEAQEPFRFGVIGHSFRADGDESLLRQALKEASQARPVFVVANGIKAQAESCGDKLYGQRQQLLDQSEAPLVVSLAASDWSDCKNSLGRTIAIERLNRLRELFFADDQSLGVHRMELSRLSSSAKFRSYAENAHWEYGRVLFATINLPANNNHFRPEAGRNSEFEDRLVANRSWLKRLFAMAKRQKMAGLVLFSDGDVGIKEENRSLLPTFSNRQDGFSSTRRQIVTLAESFDGKVLLVNAQAGSDNAGTIKWRGNIGHLSARGPWTEIRVAHSGAQLFSLKGENGGQ